MVRVKALIVALLVSAPATAAPASRAATDPPPSAEKVRELLVLTGAPKHAEFLVEQLIRTFRRSNPGTDPRFWDEIRASFTPDTYLALVAPIYQKHLTARDVDAAIAFWKTDAGRRVTAAQPGIQEESLKAGQEWGAQIHFQIAAKLKAMPAWNLYTGYIDRTGRTAVEPRFTGPGQRSFTEGLAKIEIDGEKCGFIDKTGRYAIEPTFDSAIPSARAWPSRIAAAAGITDTSTRPGSG
jgi:uncharacterized protein